MTGDASALFEGPTVSFAEAAAALARAQADGDGDAPTRTLTTTMVVIGSLERLIDVADDLQTLGNTSGVRGIVIAYGSDGTEVRVHGNTIAVAGLQPAYVNNAVAALRLSSLPTFVWWRGGPPDLLDGVADLADRVVLDDDAAPEVWRRAAELFERAAFSDLRWGRLTRWRALMAHFFDLPAVRAEAPSLTRLSVAGEDRVTLRLFAEWLRVSLGWDNRVAIELLDHPGGAICEAHLEGPRVSLALRLAGHGMCLESSCTIQGQPCATRTVLLGDQSLAALMGGELRIRARDVSFERTVQALLRMAPD